MKNIILLFLCFSVTFLNAQKKKPTAAKQNNQIAKKETVKKSIGNDEYLAYLKKVVSGDTSSIDEMISKNIDLNRPKDFEFNLLSAMVYGDIAPVWFGKVVAAGADVNQINLDNSTSALTYSIHSTKPNAAKTVEALVKSGANPQLKRNQNEPLTLLEESFFNPNSSKEKVLYLLNSKYVQINNKKTVEGINTNTLGLALAAHQPIEVISKLIEKGANINSTVQYGSEECSILTWAEYSNASIAVLNLLQKNGAKSYSNLPKSTQSYFTLNDVFSLFSSNSNKPSSSTSSSNNSSQNTSQQSDRKNIKFVKLEDLGECNFTEGHPKITYYQVFENGKKSQISSNKKLIIYKGNWYDGCPNSAFSNKINPTKTTLKSFLIRQYESDAGKADSYEVAE